MTHSYSLTFVLKNNLICLWVLSMAKPSKTSLKSSVIPKTEPGNSWKFPLSLHRVYLLLFILCCICYANTLGHLFALDDGIVLTKNIYTQQGVKGIPDLVSHDTFQGYFKGEQKNLVAGGRYRPLSLVLLAVEKSIAGDKAWFYHLIHLILYILTVCMVFRFTILVLSRLHNPDTSNWIAALTAIFFAIHPIHTEVVANIKSSDEMLSFVFGLGAIYLLWNPVVQIKTMFAAMVIYTLALFSKENAILWIPLGWLTYFMLGQLTWKQATIKIFPLVLPALIFIVIRYMVLQQGEMQAPVMEWLNNPFLKIIGNEYTYCSASEKWGSIVYSLIYYLRLHIWPFPLTHDYFPNHFPLRSMADPAVILSLVILIVLIFFAWKYKNQKPLLSYSILFFFGAMILVSNIFFPVGILFSERFAFTSSYAYCLFLGSALAPYFRLKRKSIIFFTLAFGILGISFTIVRDQAWKDNFTLFKTDIKNSPNSAKINNAYAGELLARSENTKDSLQKITNYALADRHLKKAISIHPLYVEAWLLQGNSYFYQSRYDEAISAFKKSLDIAPGYESSMTNLHLAYREGGKYWGEKMHNLEKALNYLQQAYQLNPNDFETLRLLGVAYGVEGNNVKAIEFLEKARLIKPENASVLYNLGSAYLNSGNPGKGQEFYDQARAVDSTLFNK